MYRKEKDDKKQKEKILITKKGAKDHGERITRGDSPSLRPIKKGATKRSQKLIIETIYVLKCSPISLPPQTPYQA